MTRRAASRSNVLSRRQAASAIFALPAAAMLAGRAFAQDAGTACFDPEALPRNQKSLRTSLAFQIEAADPARACKGCAFFTATSDSCGTCRLLSGGPVRPTSSCRSFAPSGKP